MLSDEVNKLTQIGSVIDGKYEILKEIGRGGMSIVYLAMDKRLNKQWAVKEIRKKGSGKNDEVVVNSLLAEANMMKRLDHPALPRIVDIIDNGVTIYVVMDYIEGESLDKILAEYGAQPEETVIVWAKQICDALAYLHSQKPPIIYRDMKPANVMLKPEGNIKIIDFGIAREYKEQSLSDTTVLGTKGYAPPEQYSGQTDPRSDIFALGMTMHHLLTGVDPRSGEAYASVRQWNPELSEGIELIIDKCVEPASENRYQNCADLLYDLDHPDLITKGYKKKQKRKLAAFLGAAVLSVAALATGFVCNTVGTNMKNGDYDTLVNVNTSSDLQIKLQSYYDAIAIYPEKPEAYLKVLEAYENEEDLEFGQKESEMFLYLYSANSSVFDPAARETAELNYKAGQMFFNYFGGVDGAFSTKVQRARSFFEANKNNEAISPEFAERELSDCYYEICTFYKDFILGKTVKEPSLQDYQKLFATIEDAMGSVRNAGAYDKLTLYNGVFMLLYDQREGMKNVNFSEQDILELFDEVYQEANALSVNKDQAKQLRQEILENYETFREAINRTFNAKADVETEEE